MMTLGIIGVLISSVSISVALFASTLDKHWADKVLTMSLITAMIGLVIQFINIILEI